MEISFPFLFWNFHSKDFICLAENNVSHKIFMAAYYCGHILSSILAIGVGQKIWYKLKKQIILYWNNTRVLSENKHSWRTCTNVVQLSWLGKTPLLDCFSLFQLFCLCHDNQERLFQLVKIATWNTKVENLDLKYELRDFFQKFERSKFSVDYLPNCRIWD